MTPVYLWRAEPDIGVVGAGFQPAASSWLTEALVSSGVAEAMGRWFTDLPENLDFYARDCEGDFRVVRVVISEEEAERWRVDHDPVARTFSKDHLHEFFLPHAVVVRAERDEQMKAEVLARLEHTSSFRR
jgi:hypothetical protein